MATPMQKPFEPTRTISSLDLLRGLSDEQLLSPATSVPSVPTEKSVQQTPTSSQDSVGLIDVFLKQILLFLYGSIKD